MFALFALGIAALACGGGGEAVRPEPETERPRPGEQVAGATGPGCAELGAGELGEPRPLLGGRLTLRVPGAARVAEPAAASSDGLPALIEETRIEIGEGDARLAILAFELFEQSGPNLAGAVREHIERQGTGDTVGPLEVADTQLRVVTATPSRPSRDAAVFVLGAWVAHPDGTVQLIAFYASRPAAERGPDECAALARRILVTVGAGDRTLDASGGARTLAGGPSPLQLTVPSGWIHDARAGDGFVVHRFRALQPIGAGGRAIGVYIGDRPRPLAAQAREARPPRPGTVFGNATEWTAFVVGPERGQRYAAEVMVPFPGATGSASVVHLFLEAPTEAVAEELRNIAQSIRRAP